MKRPMHIEEYQMRQVFVNFNLTSESDHQNSSVPVFYI